MTPDAPQALSWVRWWAQGWRQAHETWQLPATADFDQPTLTLMLQRDAALADRCMGMTASVPPPPDELLLPLLPFDAEQWQRVFELCVAVCAGASGGRRHRLDERTQRWCQRLGQALQPGQWLPAQWYGAGPEAAGLCLLRAWAGETLWSRLRLQFARDVVQAAEQLAVEQIPHARLRALWHALSWQVSRATD
ncbi:hypothetical protein NJC38_03005 [Pseudomonas sp. 21LCFQ010]|uniref:hypothetical protein n=1 Tax=Pseudomonas sp. 21LCFQ010 TaxID=2957506 RepID=UPI0020984674|nr:hypothetical protein [Pseudomonas sp. 21LCFQ010]MCO8161119.1 hypothetical protein [Pseudomonas sp. 21LCFQ010]